MVEQKFSPYLVFIFLLSVLSLGIIFWQSTLPPTSSTKQILEYADTLVCIIFLMDFCISLYQAENKRQYLLRHGWLDLISSIPMINALRWGRVARISRLFRLLRILRSGKILMGFVLEYRRESSLLATTLLTIILLTISSIGILSVEQNEAANIQSAEDAIWWAIATITTVGYGDTYPVTSEGRAIALLLMIAGVGLFGIFTGLLAAWLLKAEEDETQHEISLLRQEIQELKNLIVTKAEEIEES